MSDIIKNLEGGASTILTNLGKTGTTVEADLPGVVAQILGALHVLQEFAVTAHALLGQFFPSSPLPHPTAEGAVAAEAIAPVVVAAAPEA